MWDLYKCNFDVFYMLLGLLLVTLLNNYKIVSDNLTGYLYFWRSMGNISIYTPRIFEKSKSYLSEELVPWKNLFFVGLSQRSKSIVRMKIVLHHSCQGGAPICTRPFVHPRNLRNGSFLWDLVPRIHTLHSSLPLAQSIQGSKQTWLLAHGNGKPSA